MFPIQFLNYEGFGSLDSHGTKYSLSTQQTSDKAEMMW